MAITSANQLALLQTAEAVAREQVIEPGLGGDAVRGGRAGQVAGDAVPLLQQDAEGVVSLREPLVRRGPVPDRRPAAVPRDDAAVVVHGRELHLRTEVAARGPRLQRRQLGLLGLLLLRPPLRAHGLGARAAGGEERRSRQEDRRAEARPVGLLAHGLAAHAKRASTTSPWTSVRRWSRPAWRKVRRSCLIPSRCRIVALRS